MRTMILKHVFIEVDGFTASSAHYTKDALILTSSAAHQRKHCHTERLKYQQCSRRSFVRLHIL
jgi:hypothetical protein